MSKLRFKHQPILLILTAISLGHCGGDGGNLNPFNSNVKCSPMSSTETAALPTREDPCLVDIERIPTGSRYDLSRIEVWMKQNPAGEDVVFTSTHSLSSPGSLNSSADIFSGAVTVSIHEPVHLKNTVPLILSAENGLLKSNSQTIYKSIWGPETTATWSIGVGTTLPLLDAFSTGSNVGPGLYQATLLGTDLVMAYVRKNADALELFFDISSTPARIPQRVLLVYKKPF